MTAFTSLMEMMMVICFGISWPFNITKAWKARSAKGTSVLFYWFIWTGYICAILGKLVLIAQNAPLPWYESVKWYVMFFYVLNTLMVSSGIVIYYHNRRLDREREDR